MNGPSLKFILSLTSPRYRRNYRLIESDFDKSFYLRAYAEVLSDDADPIDHYLRIGSKLGYMPRPDFDPFFYVEQYPDVRASAMDPFVHYIKHGKSEGRSTTKSHALGRDSAFSSEDYATVYNDFDREYYVSAYKDVAEAGVDPLGHYLCTGWREGRNPCASFDTAFYLSRYTDVSASGTNPFVHYVRKGRAEGRVTSYVQLDFPSRSDHAQVRSGLGALPDRLSEAECHRLLFDAKWYLERYPDVRELKVDPLQHFLNHGAREGRDPHPLFHTRFYWSQLENAEDAAKDPISHYTSKGASQGVSPHPLFDRVWYRFGNSDVVEFGMDEFVHFLLKGDREGRSSHPLFDPIFYLRNNPEVAASTIGPLRHFLEIGWREGRNPHPMFDCQYYNWVHPEVYEQRANPLVHYLLQPRETRRHPHPLFDGAAQRLTSALARETLIDPLTDYIQFRSHLDPALVSRHATYIPMPTAAILPARAPDDRPLSECPLVSVIVPAYNSEEYYFLAMVNSVRAQTYDNWELIIIDDGSPKSHVAPMIDRITGLDRRIRSIRLEKNRGISGATNAGLERARGDFVAFVDHDDVLLSSALEDTVRAVISGKADAAYSDQAYVSPSNTFQSAFYKPDWSPVMLSGVMYINHLLVVRRDVALAAGGFDPSFDRLQDFEFMLRVGERTSRIVHVPKVLYQWRSIPGSVAHDANSKGKIEPLQAAAVNAHFARIDFPGVAAPYDHLVHRLAITPKRRSAYPPVDVLVRGDRTEHATLRCLAMLDERRSTLANIRVVGQPSRPQTKHVRGGVKRRRQEHNLSGRTPAATPITVEIRDAIASSSSPYVVFIDPLVDVVDDKWLDYLLLYAEVGDVAFAAPHLYRRDGRVAAAGLLVRRDGLFPAMRRFRFGEDGFAGSLACNREVSALPAGIIILDRAILDTSGGLDPDFSTALYMFADAAVRAVKNGYRNIAIANAILQVDSTYDVMENDACDAILFRDQHSDVIAKGDYYYNSNFLPTDEDYIAQ
jgi:O-antigen biosynthesis protein